MLFLWSISLNLLGVIENESLSYLSSRICTVQFEFVKMEASSGGSSSNSPAPFLLKTYEMVDDPLTSSVVSWSHTGHSFIVWNPPAFSRDLLPKYFKHNNFSSFIRQLNTYGFRKVDPDQWEFANWEFVQGQKHLLKNIHRRKPIHSHSGSQLNSAPVTDSERAEFEEEIERLKQEKSALESQVEKYKLENQAYQNQLRLLAQTLLNTDQSFMEGSSKKRRLFAYNQVNLLQDNIILSSFGIESIDKSESLLEKVFPGIINHIPSHDVLDLSSPSGPKNGEIPAELAASSGDSDLNVKPCTPEYHISALASHSCPSIDSPESSSMKPAENGSIPPLQQPGANDVFWEQFLSEAPASFLSQEVVQSYVKIK